MDVLLSSPESTQIQQTEIQSERQLHKLIESQTGIRFGDVDVFMINSEESTRTGVRADILGVAETGHPVIIELKQAGGGRKGSRTALTQALEYAADFRSEGYQALSEKYQQSTDSEIPLDEAHARYFSLTEKLSPQTFDMATEPRICLLAEQFRHSDIDAARYLRDANDVDISCLSVTAYTIEETLIYAFETRLETKQSPDTPLRDASQRSLPWLVRRLEESYHSRFGDMFEIATPQDASERQTCYKGTRFVSRPSHPEGLCYSLKSSVYDSAKVEFGVSPRGNGPIETIIDRHSDTLMSGFERKERKYRRVRNMNGDSIETTLSDAQLERVSPEVSRTIGTVLWNSDEFQRIWSKFLDMVERWDRIIEDELGRN